MLSDALPPLPSLENPSSYVASTGTSSAAKIMTDIGGAGIKAMTGVDISSPSNSMFGLSIQRIVVIILGLIILAAGIFMLKPVRETVIETAKDGAAAAAVA